MTRTRSRAAAIVAMVAALLIAAPLALLAFAADDPPPDGQDTGQGGGNVTTGPGLTGLVDPTVTDGPTGGILPSLPLPANPVPGDLPGLPTSLDPQDDSDVGTDGQPVTVDLSGKGVSAQVTFTGRDVSGTATGLAPGKRYVSLLYGNMSTARPGEVLTCADARTAASVQSWAVSGEWIVDDQGNGTLSGAASRDLADGVYTVSIRRVGGVGAVSDAAPLTAFTPVTHPVVACGSVPGA